ncbi:uncharacterized protein LOC135711401 [Ochlerotatus camptorhynchus]|uniref:uncharacterized protein LOC135711401 n=1 Tax=Ochlerotatus camptorhynchus TaxID=644619 RepID=UPI0031DD1718
MSGYKLIGVFLLVVIFKSVAALMCYQCFNVEKCGGDDKNTIVQCNNQSALEVAVISAFFFPKLSESFTDDNKFQCASLAFTPTGATNASIMVKGCMFETKQTLCQLETDIPNGNFSCHSCNTNKCNSGVTLGWSFLLLMVGLAATRMVK